MKAIHWITAAAALTLGLPAPADASITDPEIIIYRFPGVRDDGGGVFIGVATVFFCTNFSGVTENARLVTRRSDGSLANNSVFSVDHLATITMATHNPGGFSSFVMNTGAIAQGTTAIAATSTTIICTAAIIDAADSKPVGIALRGIRFNPVPGSQE